MEVCGGGDGGLGVFKKMEILVGLGRRGAKQFGEEVNAIYLLMD